VGNDPVYVTMRDEIIELVGEEPYAWLVESIESADAGAIRPHAAVERGRAEGVSLPDPVRRRRA